MNARLLILIVVAGALAVGLALRPINPKEAGQTKPGFQAPPGKTIKMVRQAQEPMRVRELPGETPSQAPIFHVDVEVDRASGKNRLVYHLTEEHGYYVQRFMIHFWYTDGTIESADESPLLVPQAIERYLKANDTLTYCLEVVYPELDRIGGDIGTSENWEATVISHGRYRAHNPDPLPLLGEAGACD